MNKIVCPHCKEVFTIDDEAGFADILKQVRDHEFDQEMHERLAAANKSNKLAIELVESESKNRNKEALAEKDKIIVELRSKSDLDLANIRAEKDAEIGEMKAKIERGDIEKKLALNEAVNVVVQERNELSNKLQAKENEKILLEKNLNEKHTEVIRGFNDLVKAKDEEIARHKDYKIRLSTKMVGETLEQHCEIEFNKIRATAFPTAHFGKDNDTRSGSKGDFIYRETDILNT